MISRKGAKTQTSTPINRCQLAALAGAIAENFL